MQSLIILIFSIGTIITNFSNDATSVKFVDTKTASYQIGDIVEDFSLPDIDGNTISLAQYTDAKGYIIVFTSNVCPFAVANEDRLIDIHNKMDPQGYPVIAINSNGGTEETIEFMKERATEKNYPFAYLKDNISVYEKFGATKTPHVFLLDSDMTLQYTGSIDDSARDAENVEDEFLVNAIDDLINNRIPEPATTKSIGCPIKSGNANASKERKGPPNPADLLARMDTNNDQQLSKDEAHGPIAANFDKLDIDEDGVLTLSELSKAKPGKRKRQ